MRKVKKSKKAKKYTKKIVLDIVKSHSEGITIQKLADLSGMSRITATKYIHELIGEGKITERKIGVARLLFSKEKFMEQIREKEVLEKLRKKF